MKNFGTLYGYELKKLLKRKLSWAAVLALTAFCVAGVVKVSITAKEARESALKAVDNFSGRTMDDAFIQEILEHMPDFSGMDVMERDIYLLTSDNPYISPYNRLAEILIEPENTTAERFYAAQWEHTLSYLEHYGRGSLSREEIAWWTEQAEEVPRPFAYQYPWPGATKLMDFCYTLLGLLPVAAAVCVCTVFSEDRRTRADALVFTSRKCRTPLYLAKILAGALVSALVGAVMVGAVFISHLALWGWKGMDACAQMYWYTCPQAITVWDMLRPMLLLLVLYALLCGGVSMLTAAVTRSSIVALAVPVLLAQVLYRWQPMPYGWRGYLPGNLIGYSGVINVELVKVFNTYLTAFQFGPVLYLALSALLLALCRPFWQRSVKGL